MMRSTVVVVRAERASKPPIVVGLRSSVEGDLPAREVCRLEGWVVGSCMVLRAEKSSVVQIRRSALAPRMIVVGVAHAGWPVAALGGAVAVADHQGDALSLRMEAALATDVQHFGLAAENDRDDVGAAGELPCEAG